ncbi:MAG: hypothetical protein H5U40_10275, partial [Polyangiaceae bacterium]|nr:hypothetical protein [Polyangiaceae bacterium]
MSGATYFVATDPRNGAELHRTNPEGDDAALVIDLFPGPTGSEPSHLTLVGAHLYFVASTPEHGRSLFRTLGTAETTELVSDLAPGTADASFAALRVVGTDLYFIGEATVGQPRLHRVTGESPTVTPILLGGAPAETLVVGDSLYVLTGANPLRVLHRIAAGTSTRVYPHPLAAVGANMRTLVTDGADLFLVVDEHGVLRVTANGAVFLGSVGPSIGALGQQCNSPSGTISRLVPYGQGRVAVGVEVDIQYCTNTGHGYAQWYLMQQGQAVTTMPGYSNTAFTHHMRQRITQVATRGTSIHFVICEELRSVGSECDSGGSFRAHTLYTFNGSSASVAYEGGAARVDSISPMTHGLLYRTNDAIGRNGAPTSLSAENGYSQVNVLARSTTGLFVAATRAGKRGLYYLTASDGEATLLGEGFDPSTTNVATRPVIATVGGGLLMGRLAFPAKTSEHGRELYMAESVAGTARLVRDIHRPHDGSAPASFAALEGHVIFAADDGVYGGEVYRTRGTAANTALAADIWTGADSSAPFGFTSVRGQRLYFGADDGYSGTELWSLESPTAAPVLVADIFGGTTPAPNGAIPNASIPMGFVTFGEHVYFAATNGPVDDVELYRHSGSGAMSPVEQVVAVNPNPEVGSDPRSLVVSGGKLFFIADDGVHGEQLFVTDGTAQGTMRLQHPDQPAG